MKEDSDLKNEQLEIIKSISSMEYPGVQIISRDEPRILKFLINHSQDILKYTKTQKINLFYHNPNLEEIRKIKIQYGKVDFSEKAQETKDWKINPQGESYDVGLLRIFNLAASFRLFKERFLDPTLAKNASEKLGVCIFIFSGYSEFLKKSDSPPSTVISALMEVERLLRMETALPWEIVFLNSSDSFPDSMSRLCKTFDYPLPDESEINEIFTDISGKELPDSLRKKMVLNSLGLETSDIRSLAGRCKLEGYNDENVIMSLISREKEKIIRNSRSLELIEPKESLEDIGGLDTLKGWLNSRAKYYKERERAEQFEKGLERPKGILLVGLPGTGKSLSAKAAKMIFGIPLLRFDVAATFEKWVGSSEENMRAATRVAEAMAPCILWIDEIEKAFSGMGSNSGGGEGGTGTRNFGYFLTWMQDCKKPIFIFATANDITGLQNSNPEFFRYGRFDEKFFLDLPNEVERKKIWEIHFLKRVKSLKLDEAQISKLVEVSDKWTGAEIEACVKEALMNAFSEERQGLSYEDIFISAQKIVPQIDSMQSIKEMRGLKDKLKFRSAT